MESPVVLITGSLTGIGRATAFLYARQGAKLVISGRREEAGQALARELRALAREVEYVHADVREEAQVRRLVDTTVQRFGRLDIAVNNAGIEGSLGPITDQSTENYLATFDANVLGTFLALKHEMRIMLAQKSGSIVNLSSMAGRIGMPGASIYVASKHAVEGLTKTAALEGAAAGVRVNAVAPGPIDTEMFDRFFASSDEAKSSFLANLPARRAGTPDEIAETISFLASDKARFLTGQCVAVDGGYTAQ
ncbi:MAG: glucose 1-dehydrogenase [Myxococcota bacterium]